MDPGSGTRSFTDGRIYKKAHLMILGDRMSLPDVLALMNKPQETASV